MPEVLEELSSAPLPTSFGTFTVRVFHDGRDQAVVLTHGDFKGGHDIPCRVHSQCFLSHYFSSALCNCASQLSEAMRAIQKEGRGVVICLPQEGRGNGIAAHVASLNLRTQGLAPSECYRQTGFQEDARQYMIAAKILNRLGINSVVLLGGNLAKLEEFRRHGIPAQNVFQPTWPVVLFNPVFDDLLHDIVERRLIPPFAPPDDARRVIVLGDLNVDYFVPLESNPDQLGPRTQGRAGTRRKRVQCRPNVPRPRPDVRDHRPVGR